jgi:TPP-dependent 2-oxoacid decarboxylase
MAMTSQITIGDYLIRQLSRYGIRHVFGIPGDYILGFYDMLERCEQVRVINTSDEQGAGFAADAYARVNGLGAVCVTYGVGALKVANTTAQAYAEKSPVIIISGAPGAGERQGTHLLHHQISDLGVQKRIFDEFTVASAVLDSPDTAQQEIDRVIHTALKFKRPVYIELPRDMVFVPCPAGYKEKRERETSDPETLAEALQEAVSLIDSASRPVILAGVEIHRFGLQKELTTLARDKGIPVAATILAKSVVADTRDFYMGIYEGATGFEDVCNYVESSDCLLLLGALMTDLNLGLFTAKIDQAQAIYATSEKISIKRHRFDNILFQDFMRGLSRAPITPRAMGDIPRPQPPRPISNGKNSKVTIETLFQHLNAFLKKNTIVIADVGDALFGANDLYIHRSMKFLSPAYYASLGFAIPGALGAQLADPEFRPLVLVGDGAFQMTGMELSSIARYGLNPIVIVINNQGYSTERPILDGPFNDVHPWQFSKVPAVLGGGIGFIVENEEELAQALLTADKNTYGYTIIDVKIDRDDRSPALNRLTRRLAEKVRAKVL